GGDGAGAGERVAARCTEGKRTGGQMQEGIKPGQGEAVAEACAEDGVMLPQGLPMLAVAAKPFDSPDYSFEIKYDGVRALTAVDESGWELWGRDGSDYTARYPHFPLPRPRP